MGKSISLFIRYRRFFRPSFLRYLLLLLIVFSFFTNGYASREIKIKVRSEKFREKTNLFLYDEDVSDYIQIADEKLLKSLKDNEKEIDELKRRLVDAERAKENEPEIDRLRKEIEKAENRFRCTISRYDQESIKVILEKKYPYPIYLFEKGEAADCKDGPLFYFDAEGGVEAKIRVRELKNLEENIEAELSVKDNLAEVVKKDGEYRLVFEQAQKIVVKFQGELKGEAVLKFGISPQIDNPIEFSETQSPAGKRFKIKIPEDRIDTKNDQLHVYFLKDSKNYFSPKLPLGNKRPEDPFYIFRPTVPDGLKGRVDVAALIIDNEGIIKSFNSSKLRVSNQTSAGLLAVAITMVVIYLITLLVKEGREKSWKSPLNFTETPLHRYSISLLQILLWTSITIFSYIYVYLIRGEFILLSNQILILLGISGGTSLAAKAAAIVRWRDIPDKYFKSEEGDLRDDPRKPKLTDYVSISGLPNLFKFQIIGFTLITGIIVVLELIKTSNFPEIPEELLTLMGISGSIYIGNELATENVWKKLDEKVISAEKKFKNWKVNRLKIEREIKEKKLKLDEREKEKETKKPEKDEALEKEIEILMSDIDKLNEKVAEIDVSKREHEDLKAEIYEELKKIYK